MRWLEVRRHAYTKKGPARGTGSHLSQEGVDAARRAGAEIGVVQRVTASTVPRTLETALAMGFAVNVLAEMGGEAWQRAQAEAGHHAQWEWADPFARYLTLIGGGGAVAELARRQAELWAEAASQVADGGTALVISHGGLIEPGLVACLPGADRASWGGPFAHCEGVRLAFDGARFTGVTIRRQGPSQPAG
jgi:broad specificity phosphatase PhoE